MWESLLMILTSLASSLISSYGSSKSQGKAFDKQQALSSAGSTALNTVGSIAGQYAQNKMNKSMYYDMNDHLTGAQTEANAFTAQQAQINRDFEADMSNTAYQRGVADMQAAGLNPALMYGNGAAASTPTGSNASSVSPASVGLDNVVQAIATMKTMEADVNLKNAQGRYYNSKAHESDVNADQIVEMTQNIIQERGEIKERIRGLGLSNEYQEIINSYVDEMEQAKLDNLKQDYEVKKKEVDRLNEVINNLDADTKKKAQETINLIEQVNLMITQEHLNEAEASKAYAMIGEINQNIEILKKDNSHYDWNHLKTISFKDGVAVVPDANGQYAGSFTGASAAIRPKGKKK